MAVAAISAGIGAASLGYGIFKGIKASHQANQIDKNNPRPTYQIPDEYKQNLAMAKQMAQIGIPQQSYNNQENAINRNQSGAVSALQTSGNPVGLAGIVRAGNDANNNLNAQDALARKQGQAGVMQANNAIANQKLNAQQYNQFDKYSENFNRSQALKSASNSDWNNAFNGAAGLSGALATNNLGFGKQSQPYIVSQGTAAANQVPQSLWNNFGAPTQQQPQNGGFNSFYGNYNNG